MPTPKFKPGQSGNPNGKPKDKTPATQLMVKALQRKHALPDNAAIRAWLEQAVKDSGGYDDHEALTKQVKRMIVESFVYYIKYLKKQESSR